jgi:hypothetical protein
LQRRIRDARRDAVARSVGRTGERRSLLDRVLRREPGDRPLPLADLDTEVFRHDGEDVWKSLRY